MNKLGSSKERFTNAGAKIAFWLMNIVILLFIGLLIFIEMDNMGKVLVLLVIPLFIALNVYMFFQSKSEVNLREHGLYIRKSTKQYEVLYEDITKFDKTMRVGKSGAKIIVFYLMVIETKNEERITFPFRVNEDFLQKLADIGTFKFN